MHEAALADAVASRLRREGLLNGSHPPVRIVVSGGHTDAASFDAALLLHLTIAAPELIPGQLDIIHRPRRYLCGRCGSAFSDLDEASCPSCGGPGISPRQPEQVEIEW